jgi:hypothetical protein
MKLFKSLRVAAVALLALGAAFIAKPTQAQVMNNADQVTLQLNLGVPQLGSSVAVAAASAGEGIAESTNAALGNSLDIAVAFDTNSQHLGGWGAVDTEVNNLTVQVNALGAQVGGSTAQAVGTTKAFAKSINAAIGNSANIGVTVKTVTKAN